MLAIDNTIISDDLYQVRFMCHLHRCMGNCCVNGDAGAPLEQEEISLIEDYLDHIREFMTEEGLLTIENNGVFDYDIQGNFVTPLVNDGECAFTNFENGIAFCSIERAHERKSIPLKKPISCHLYPVRITSFRDFEAINFHKWSICKPAFRKGKKDGIPLYRFLEKALIRRFGKDWYGKLEALVKEREDEETVAG